MVLDPTVLQWVKWQTRAIVDAAASGTLLSKTTEEAFRLLEEMSANNYQWPREWFKKAVGIHEMDPQHNF